MIKMLLKIHAMFKMCSEASNKDKMALRPPICTIVYYLQICQLNFKI